MSARKRVSPIRSGFSLKRAGGLSALAGVLTLGVAIFASQAAIAGGNPHFEGIISAAPPTGFMSSPIAYDISGGPATVNFDDVATNLTSATQTVGLNFSAHHIVKYNGVDVSDGQPGQPGITFTGPAGTVQALVPGAQAFTETWAPSATNTISLTYVFDACGYYQLDVWAAYAPAEDHRATLASGFIRVLGCESGPTPTPTLTPTPTATPSPSGGVGGATATPTPSSGVQGITSTPSTGAGSGWFTIGALLVIAGAGMLVIGVRGRRIDV
jgi:LPXTG cell wall anchor motif